MTQPTLINLHHNEYIEALHYYPFAVNLGSCMGNFNTHKDPSTKVYVPYKAKDLNVSIFNM